MKLIGNLVTCVAVAAACSALSSAQQRSGPIEQADRDRLRREYELRERDRSMRGREPVNDQDVMGVLGPMASDSDPAAEARLSQALIRQNLTRLQAANSLLTKHGVQGGNALDFREIARGASQLKKSAVKLRDNLALPGVKGDTPRREVTAGPEHLKLALTSLSSLVGEFVRNPVLQGEVIEAESSAKARRDLDQIIRLSEVVKQSSEKAGKILGQSHGKKKVGGK